VILNVAIDTYEVSELGENRNGPILNVAIDIIDFPPLLVVGR
jgi:hypothetical protein